MKKSELFFSFITVPLDYLAIIAAGIISYQIRYLPAVQDVRPVIFNLPFNNFFYWSLIIGWIWIFIFAISGLYTIKGPRKQIKEIGRIILSCSAGIAIVMGIMFFTRYLFDSRFIIISAWALSIIMVSAERVAIGNLQKYLYRYGIGSHRVILIGTAKAVALLANEFNARPKLGYQVIKIFSEFNEEMKNIIEQYAKDDMVDEVILTEPNFEKNKLIELVDLLNFYHLDFKYAADLLGTKSSRLEIINIAGIPVVEVKKTPLDGWGRIIKRIFDIFFSTIFVIIFSPLMVAVAIAIKLDSPGPAFFKYKRVGQKGNKFNFIKFRSMIDNAHQLRFDENFNKKNQNLRAGTPMIKFKNDPRITRVGKFIRKWSIDELPQFFLAITGQMSLVGPRPHEMEEVLKYNKYHREVLRIKPGITGLAQVSGRSDLNFEDEVNLDTYYIQNWSLLLDFQILLKTPKAIIKKRNAE